jgi:hypothetical protein
LEEAEIVGEAETQFSREHLLLQEFAEMARAFIESCPDGRGFEFGAWN